MWPAARILPERSTFAIRAADFAALSSVVSARQGCLSVTMEFCNEREVNASRLRPTGLHLRSQHIETWIRGAHAVVAQHAQQLDDINFFEAPDSDTGRNLLRTLARPLAALDQELEDRGLDALCCIVADAAWKGSSGCSGLILASVMRAMLDVFRHSQPVSGIEMAAALDAGARAARLAVRRVVQGTMVTLMGDVAEATNAMSRGASLSEVATVAQAAADDALERTARELPESCGEVDAGALGLWLVLSALFGEAQSAGR